MLARLAAIAALTLLLVWSLTAGAAWWLLERIEARPLVTVVGIDAALATATLARRLDPFSSRAWQVTGRLQEQRAAVADGVDEARCWLALALASWRHAVARRPADPYAAAALARVLVKTGAAPGQVEAAFARAVARGRHEPGAQRSLLSLGFGAWSVLPRTMRDRVMAVALDALLTDPHAAMAIAADTGRWAVLEPLIAVLADDDPALAVMAEPFAGRSVPADDPWEWLIDAGEVRHHQDGEAHEDR